MEFYIDIQGHLPSDFFGRMSNERIMMDILDTVYHYEKIQYETNPSKREPDFIVNDTHGFEMTLASKREGATTFIQKFKTGHYASQNSERDLLAHLRASAARKAKKVRSGNYCLEKINLVTLSPITVFSWWGDYFGSEIDSTDKRRQSKLFFEFQQQYIATGTFENIYIILLTFFKSFAVFDVKNQKRHIVPVPKGYIGYPYYTIKGSGMASKPANILK